MANDISEYIDAINNAVRGEEVRDAIINAVTFINDNGGNAYYLDGHPSTDFVLASAFKEVYPLDARPTDGSTKGVTSDGIYRYIMERMTGVLIHILGLDVTESELYSENLTDRLQEIADIKKSIKKSIRNKGVEVTEETRFDEYAGKIDSISGTDISLSELTISDPQDKEYDAGVGKGYNPVNVKLNFSSRLIKKTIAGSSLGDDPTVDKTFKPEDEPEYESASKENKPIGYSEITVKVSDKLGEYPLEVDPNNTAMEYTIYAKDSELFGFSSIKVSIKESEGPFTVKFWESENKKALLYEEDNVPKHGCVTYNGSMSISEIEKAYAPAGMKFDKWNPLPIDIIRNTECFAQYINKTGTEGVSQGEIPSTWSDIGKNGGRDIAIGDWKLLKFEGGFGSGAFSIPEGTHYVLMQKVASGEGGTSSTWLSRTPLWSMPMYDRIVSDPFSTTAAGYGGSGLKNFLENDLFNAINAAADDEIGGTSSFGAAIKPITKKWLGFDDLKGQSHTLSLIALGHRDNLHVWLPSATELGVDYFADETNGIFESAFEDNARTYVDARGSLPTVMNPPISLASRIVKHTWTRTSVPDEMYRQVFTKTSDSKVFLLWENGSDIRKVYITYTGGSRPTTDRQTAVNLQEDIVYYERFFNYVAGEAYYQRSYIYVDPNIYDKDGPAGEYGGNGLYSFDALALQGFESKTTPMLAFPVMFGFCT